MGGASAPIPGIDGKNVVGAEDAYVNPEKQAASSPFSAVDSSASSLPSTWQCSVKVTVIEMLDKISDGGNFLHVLGLKMEMKRLGIALYSVQRRRSQATVFYARRRGRKFIGADTVIYA